MAGFAILTIKIVSRITICTLIRRCGTSFAIRITLGTSILATNLNQKVTSGATSDTIIIEKLILRGAT